MDFSPIRFPPAARGLTRGPRSGEMDSPGLQGAPMEKTTLPSSISGSVTIPGSKSHTIRALLVASLAKGTSTIDAPLHSDDTHSCRVLCESFGAEITDTPTGWNVTGFGKKARVPDNIIDVGNSGTTLYLGMGIAASIPGVSIMTGDAQIRQRSAENLIHSLNDLGAEVESTRGNGCAPVIVRGPILGGNTSIECPTSQYLSSLLLAAPLGYGTSTISVPLLQEVPYVEMTLDWLKKQGISWESEGMSRFIIPGDQAYKPFSRRIPADFSSATFFFCAAAITGSTLRIKGLDMSDTQGDKLTLDMLSDMGCTISFEGDDILVTGTRLVGRELDLNATPDALPAMAVTAAFAEGTTRIRNVAHARLKETDRISVMTRELTKLGVQVRELPDGMEITGGGITGGKVHGHHDHRIVMALSLAGLASTEGVTVDTAEAAAITFPEFFDLLDSIKT